MEVGEADSLAGQPIEVNLQETATGNEGLVHLAGLTTVQEISLHQTKVTDAGLVHIKALVNLERLFLSDTQTADDGLVHLAGLKKLKVLGLSGTLCGVALAVALVFDAITDPLAGTLSDRLDSRWGRRHPFMYASAVPLGLFFALLFTPPASTSIQS